MCTRIQSLSREVWGKWKEYPGRLCLLFKGIAVIFFEGFSAADHPGFADKLFQALKASMPPEATDPNKNIAESHSHTNMPIGSLG